MKIEATVKRVGELRTGTSKTTGNKWAIRDLLLSWNDETGENYISATIDAERLAGSGIEQGSTVRANLLFFTKLLPSGGVANDVRIANLLGCSSTKARMQSRKNENENANL